MFQIHQIKKELPKRARILLAISLTGLLVGIILSQFSFQTKNDTQRYQQTKTDQAIVIHSRKDKEKIFEQKESDYYVYFYYDDCSFCQKVEPTLTQFLKHSQRPVYFVDTEAKGAAKVLFSDKETKGTSQDNWYIDGTPTLFRVKNKKIVTLVSGTSAVIEELKYHE